MKRTLATGAILVVLAALPAAAQAYPAPVAPAEISNTNPAPGEPVTVTATGLETATTATMTVTSEDPSIPDTSITIAGTASLTKDVPGSTVEFTVTHAVEGVYSHSITTDAGHVIPGQVITVGNPGGSGSGDGAGSGQTDGSGGSGAQAAAAGDGLAETGAGTVAGMAALAGGLLVVGAGGTYLVRRGSRSRGNA